MTYIASHLDIVSASCVCVHICDIMCVCVFKHVQKGYSCNVGSITATTAKPVRKGTTAFPTPRFVLPAEMCVAGVYALYLGGGLCRCGFGRIGCRVNNVANAVQRVGEITLFCTHMHTHTHRLMCTNTDAHVCIEGEVRPSSGIESGSAELRNMYRGAIRSTSERSRHNKRLRMSCETHKCSNIITPWRSRDFDPTRHNPGSAGIVINITTGYYW